MTIKPEVSYEMTQDGRVILEMQDVLDMVKDVRRLEWLVENSAELILKDDYFGVGYGVNTVLTSKDNWRDAIDDAMKESE